MHGTGSAPSVRFGAVTLIPAERLVLKDGRPVPFNPKTFDLLVVLSANPGRLLTKEHLMQAVWPDTAVEESNLAYHVSAIRKALGQGADGGGYIETVPKHGYRFVATIVPAEGQDRAASVAPPFEPGAPEPRNDSDRSAGGPTNTGTTLPDRMGAGLEVPLDGLVAESVAARVAQQTAVTRVGRSRRRAWPTAVLVMAAATFVGWQAGRSPDRPAPLRAIPLTSLPGVVRYPSFSPDGNHVVFTWNGPKQNNPDVYVQQIGAGSPLQLTTDAGNDFSPIWSPDGRSIAFLRQPPDSRLIELRLVPPLGGPERKVTTIRPNGAFLRPVTMAWCPDSRCVVVSDAPDEAKPADALFVVSVDTGEKRQLTHPPLLALADTDPAVSPDGKWLVFRRDAGPFAGRLQLLALGPDLTATGEPRPLTSNAQAAYHPEWMSDSSEILFSAKGSLWRLRLAEGSAAERLPFVGEDGLMPAVSRPRESRSARLVYVRSFADTNIWRIDTAGVGAPATSPPVKLIASTRRDGIPEFSPDGQRVAFTSDRSGELEMWVADTGGRNPIQLTSMAAVPGFGRWSPDGKTIAFHSNPEGKPDILVVPADGGQPRKLTNHPDPDGFPSFSHDGRWIYFSSARTGEPVICRLPVSGGDAVQISPGRGRVPIESPDGAFLYYGEATASDRPGPLVRLSLKDGTVVRLLDNVDPMSFAVVDEGIYYVERTPGEARLRYFDLSTRESTLIARNLGEVGFGITASPDGRVILFSRVDSSVDDLMLVENFR